MRSSVVSAVAIGARLALAAAPGSNAPPWDLANLTSLVIFGDSYSDDSRLGYFIGHNGSAPPVGYDNPVSYAAADGGRVWGEYVKQYTGANLYNYAVSGAVCSNEITPRYFAAIDADFPDVPGYEVPAYLNDSKYYVNGTKFLIEPVDQTVFAIWIGTNDLGYYAFIEDQQVPGKYIPDYMDCVFDQIQALYDNGGRYFVFMNVVPLQLTAIYGEPGVNAAGPNQYWPDKAGNFTEINARMAQQVVSTDAIYATRVPYATEIYKRFPGAHVALYDVYSLFYDIHNNPSEFLNGTAPLNVTGFYHHCSVNGTNCTTVNDSPDSFLWYDELHPTEQTERNVASNFVDVIKGSSKYATYWFGG